MRRTALFIAEQATLIVLAALSYFAVRGMTEGGWAEARFNAARILRIERLLHLDIELGIQALVQRSDLLVDSANWVYIWGHWPVIAVTLAVLAVTDRRAMTELRNAMFISGAIGLVIYATFAVAPPRLFSINYLDTVTLRSTSYRVLQPPSLMNRYAAVPSLHFGWNLLVGLSWRQMSTGRLGSLASMAMPAAMGFAVVATANHWVLDAILGGLVALVGLMLERRRARGRSTGRSRGQPATGSVPDGIRTGGWRRAVRPREPARPA